MPTRPLLFLAAAVMLGLSSGCGPAKLDEKKTYQLAPGETRFLILPPQPRAQRLTVEFESDQPIDVGIYKSDDVKDQPSILPSSKARAVERAKKSGTLSADLGPDDAVTVTVTGLSSQSTTSVHVTNRK